MMKFIFSMVLQMMKFIFRIVTFDLLTNLMLEAIYQINESSFLVYVF